MRRLQVTQADILSNFNDGAYARGLDYYRNNRVLKYDIYEENEGGICVHARVQGGERYRQHIEIWRGGEGLIISADCDCPVGYNCKHAVAVLFKMMHSGMQRSQKDEAELWLSKFLAAGEKSENRVQEQEFFLVYRLFEHTYDDFGFYKTKILKNGQLSKGTHISKENLFAYAYYEWKYPYITAEDKQLITQLRNTSVTGYTHCFEGEYGAFILKKLCETGRCFFRKNDRPLRYDSRVKQLAFHWKKKGKRLVLASNLEADEFLVYATIPALCIDTEANLLYRVETDYTPKQLEVLLEKPAFEQDAAEKIAKQVLQKTPDKTFPVPGTLKIETLETAPLPSLYLYGEKREKGVERRMELHFLYGDYEISPHPFMESQLFFGEDVQVKVLRDQDAEDACKERLEAAGFVFDSEGASYVADACIGTQAELELWRHFSQTLMPELQAEGWQIERDGSLNAKFSHVEHIVVENTARSETNDWFTLSFSVTIGGESIALLPVVASLLEEFDSVEALPEKLNLEIEEGHFLHVDAKEIAPILKTIFELYDKQEGDTLRIDPFDAHLVAFDEQHSVVWKGIEELQALSRKLKNFDGIEKVEPSEKLHAVLRAYQQFGLEWLHFLYSYRFGGILADDMGLGKTVQTLAFLQLLKEKGELKGPVLIIMPTSLIGNWKNEIEKFTPDLSYLEMYGSERAEKFGRITSHDIVLTTYALAQRDKEKYDEEHFFYIVLDEAQKIKNPKTKLAVAIKGFNSRYKLALTGTPVENHLGELWSIFDFLMPGFLGSLSEFRALYQLPIEVEHDLERKAWLSRKTAPFILRRTKEDVAKELPPKTEIIKKARFGKRQAALYENIRITMEKRVRDAIAGKGLSRSHITILDALLKLRQVCCHPRLLKLENASQLKESAKLELFLELVDELHAEGRKVLVFSQFTSMLGILETEIKKRKIAYSKLTGATRKREEAIAKFTKGDAQIFLISLKAGGVGLNLVEADTVIHYDPWWNPAVENQATDRAYRIGQKKAVFVYKLIVENSIEEQILELQKKKQSLQNGIYSESKEKEERLSGEELVALLRM